MDNLSTLHFMSENKRKLIDQIGAELGASDAARAKWPQRGVPHKWRLPIMQKAAERGMSITVSDFATPAPAEAANG